jgi:D-alanyl-D-alanine carboxypeptidase
VAGDGFPAALASVRSGRRVDNLIAGVGDLSTGAPVPVDGYIRVGSNTKTFTAVVVLQLVGEGLIGLDEPVETYLPGLLRGDGIDGNNITVRQLLQHTSGLPNYTDIFRDGLLPFQHRYMQPVHLADIALERPAEFVPGERWGYSNTNYVVAGLLIEGVTGRPVIEEITERTIEPLGLRHTYFPNVGDEGIRRPHPHGYHTDDPAGPLVDVTISDPSFGWAAGQLISTPSDLARFFTALLDGRLLEPELLAEMQATVAAPDLAEIVPGTRYGLGLTSTPLTCGGLAWGHGGDIPGYHTSNGAIDGGRSAVIAVTRLPADLAEITNLSETLDTALCA